MACRVGSRPTTRVRRRARPTPARGDEWAVTLRGSDGRVASSRCPRLHRTLSSWSNEDGGKGPPIDPRRPTGHNRQVTRARRARRRRSDPHERHSLPPAEPEPSRRPPRASSERLRRHSPLRAASAAATATIPSAGTPTAPRLGPPPTPSPTPSLAPRAATSSALGLGFVTVSLGARRCRGSTPPGTCTSPPRSSAVRLSLQTHHGRATRLALFRGGPLYFWIGRIARADVVAARLRRGESRVDSIMCAPREEHGVPFGAHGISASFAMSKKCERQSSHGKKCSIQPTTAANHVAPASRAVAEDRAALE